MKAIVLILLAPFTLCAMSPSKRVHPDAQPLESPSKRYHYRSPTKQTSPYRWNRREDAKGSATQRLTSYPTKQLNKFLPGRQVTPLMEAASFGQLELVKDFIARGAEVDASLKSSGETALSHAVKSSYARPEVVEYLLRAGAQPNRQPHRSMLIQLVTNPQPSRLVKMQMLIDHGADINAKDTHKMSPLAYAIMIQDRDAQNLLIKNGATLDTSAREQAQRFGIAPEIEERIAKIKKSPKKSSSQPEPKKGGARKKLFN